MMQRFGALMALSGLLLFAFPAYAGHNGNRNTQTTVQCAPSPANSYQIVTCTAFVQDMYGVAGQRASPTGTVSFSVVTGPGSLSPASCSLAPTGMQGQSSCSVSYTPTAGGTHTISASYSGAAATSFIGNWLPSSGSGSVTVNNPVPSIASVNPAFGLRGDTLDITISGSNFASSGVTVSLGANITVNSVTWVSSGTLSVNVSIAAAAATGFRSVTVTNPAPVGGSATLTNGFEVRNPLPVITSLTPAAVEIGSGAYVVTIDGSGFVSDSVAWFNGGARATTFVNSGQLQMSITAADTNVLGSYPVHVVNAAPGGGTSNTLQFSVVPSGGSFDTVEPTTALGSAMYTKLAGTAFNLDLLATDISRTSVNTGFTGTVKIELLDATDDSAALDANGCRASWALAQSLPDATFTAADNGRISVNTGYANALRVARFRISYPAAGAPSHVGCSSDAFSIRPSALALTLALTNGGSTGAPIHAAGAAFTMTATAIPGYDGTPQIDGSRVTAHTGANAASLLGGSFAAADVATGISTGNTFSYIEVGNFELDARAVHDATFTAIDQPDDCTADFSNTATGGKYGCSFGTASVTDVGRFVPAYFDVTVTDACADASGFTYSGQPFTVTVTAREAGGAPTQYYVGAYARDVTLSDAGDASDFETGTNLVAAALFSGGVADNTVTTYVFPDAETAFTAITLRATDADGVSSSGHIEESTQIRSARLVIDNGSAITTSDGLVTVTLQAWQEVSPGVHEWAVHADDTTCTDPDAANFSLVNFIGNLASGETSVSGFFFNAGQGALTLAQPGAGNDGTVDVNVITDTWLHFDWSGTGTRVAPTGSMTFFEIYESEEGLIDRFEVVP